MDRTELESFLTWGEGSDDFPDLQYTLDSNESFSWDQFLDDYLDSFPLGALAPIGEKVEPIDAIPELSPSPTYNCEIQILSESVTELKDRLNGLEDRIAEKQKRIADLEAYIESLQPFLLQLGSSIEGLLTGIAK